MHPACNNYRSSDGNFFRSWAEVCNNCHFAVVACNSFANYRFTYAVFRLRHTQPHKQFCAIWVSVWIAMSHIYFVIVMHELHCKSQRVIKTTSFLLQCVLEVDDVWAVAIPTNSVAIMRLSFFGWIEQRLHSLVVRTLRFHQIDNVELVSREFPDIWNFEVEPLSVSSCIMIILQNQIVLVVSYFDRTSQVAIFKPRFKYQCRVFIVFFLVEWLQFLVPPVQFWNFLLKYSVLTIWAIRVIFAIVYRLVVWRQLNYVIFIDVRSIIAFPLDGGRWVIHAVENNLFAGQLII